MSGAVGNAFPMVVFDGECGFCRCTVSWAKRRLHTNAHFVPLQRADLAALGLTAAACREAVQWVDASGVRAGHRAVARLLQSAQAPWRLMGYVVDAPVLRLVSRVTYAVVKANRSRLVQLCRQPIE